jgi:hypothetical protein
VKALEELAREKGLDVVSSRAPMRTLEGFYIDTLKKQDES